MTPPRVIGIDPSLTATGYAHTDGSLNTIPSRLLKGDARLYGILNWLRNTLKVERPTHAVIEDLPTNAYSAGVTGMVQGIVRIALIEQQVPYITIPAATLKKFACGKGNGNKADMRMALYQRGGRDIEDDNQVDAAWLRELGLHKLGQPTIGLPKTHLEALNKIGDWI